MCQHLIALCCGIGTGTNKDAFPAGKFLTLHVVPEKSDVISLLFFNANLEHALRQWKRTSKTNGFQIGAVQKLTNVRHADDIMIHAKCMDELVDEEL